MYAKVGAQLLYHALSAADFGQRREVHPEKGHREHGHTDADCYPTAYAIKGSVEDVKAASP